MLKTLTIFLIVIAVSTPVFARETQEQNNARATKQMNQTIFQMKQVRKSWPQNEKNKAEQRKKGQEGSKGYTQQKKNRQECPEGYTKYRIRKNNKTVYECREVAKPQHRQ